MDFRAVEAAVFLQFWSPVLECFGGHLGNTGNTFFHGELLECIEVVVAWVMALVWSNSNAFCRLGSTETPLGMMSQTSRKSMVRVGLLGTVYTTPVENGRKVARRVQIFYISFKFLLFFLLVGALSLDCLSSSSNSSSSAFRSNMSFLDGWSRASASADRT